MVWKTPTHEVTKGNDWCGKKNCRSEHLTSLHEPSISGIKLTLVAPFKT